MRPSDERYLRAAETIDQVVVLLAPSHIESVIDAPIDAAVSTFRCGVCHRQSHAYLLQLTADLLRHVLCEAFPSGRRLTEEDALDEALKLLHQLRPGHQRDGYSELVAEVAEAGEPAILQILREAADHVKATYRQLYASSVIARELDLTDLSIRCALAAVLVSRLRSEFPRETPVWSMERCARSVEHLIMVYLRLRHTPILQSVFERT